MATNGPPTSPFIGPTYALSSRPASVQRTVNMTPVPLEPGNDRSGWVLRDVPGLALVNQSVAPPSTVILRLPFDTDLLDRSIYAHAHSRYVGAFTDEPLSDVQSSVTKYGAGSYRAEYAATTGSSNVTQLYANGPECALTGDFTVQMWLNLALTFSNRITAIASSHVQTAGGGLVCARTGEWGICFDNGSSKFVYFNGTTEGYCSFGGVFPNNVWFHIAVVRLSGTIKTYLNGVHNSLSDCTLVESATIGGVYPISVGGSQTTSGVSPDFMQSASAGSSPHSYIDDLMISSIAEYTANFTPSGPLRLR